MYHMIVISNEMYKFSQKNKQEIKKSLTYK